MGGLETFGYHEVYSIDVNPKSDEDLYDREYVLYRWEKGAVS